jgi:hypothetical protein
MKRVNCNTIVLYAPALFEVGVGNLYFPVFRISISALLVVLFHNSQLRSWKII